MTCSSSPHLIWVIPRPHLYHHIFAISSLYLHHVFYTSSFFHSMSTIFPPSMQPINLPSRALQIISTIAPSSVRHLCIQGSSYVCISTLQYSSIVPRSSPIHHLHHVCIIGSLFQHPFPSFLSFSHGFIMCTAFVRHIFTTSCSCPHLVFVMPSPCSRHLLPISPPLLDNLSIISWPSHLHHFPTTISSFLRDNFTHATFLHMFSAHHFFFNSSPRRQYFVQIISSVFLHRVSMVSLPCPHHDFKRT